MRSVTDFYKMFDDAWMFDADITNWGSMGGDAPGITVCTPKHEKASSTTLMPLVGDMFLNAVAWRAKYKLKKNVYAVADSYSWAKDGPGRHKVIPVEESNIRHGPPCVWESAIGMVSDNTKTYSRSFETRDELQSAIKACESSWTRGSDGYWTGGWMRTDCDATSWDVSKVKDMRFMFSGASTFNQPLSTWNVSGVTNMAGMFYRASLFNGDLSTWDVSGVSYMNYMFSGASSFNQDLSTWDVSKVRYKQVMFWGCPMASTYGRDGQTWPSPNRRLHGAQQSRARLGAPRLFTLLPYLAMFTFVAFAAVVRRKSRRASMRECDAVLVSSRAYDYGSTLESSRDVEASRR